MRPYVLAALLVSTSTFACPNLSGTYSSCQIQGDTSGQTTDLVVSQKTENKVTIYTADSSSPEGRMVETYRADGSTVTTEETDPEFGSTILMKTKASCQGTKALVLDISISIEGQQVAVAKSTITKTGDTLKTVTKTTSMGQVTNQTTICN